MATAEMIKALESYKNGMESLVVFWGKVEERSLASFDTVEASYEEGCKDVYELIVEDVEDFLEAAKR